MIVRRIAPGSAAKVGGVLYALIGLIFGALFSLFAMVGGGMAGADAMPFAGLFGAGAIIVFPILYGCAGFICMFIGAVLYNVVAGWVGGISLDLE